MTIIMMGVAKTGGKVTSLKRLARCSGVTLRLNEPDAPTGIDFMNVSLVILLVVMRDRYPNSLL